MNKNFQTAFTPGQTLIRSSGKVFDHHEVLLAIEAVLDGWWTEGRFTRRFCRQLANFLQVKYCIPTNSGSSANLLAFAALTSPSLAHRRLQPGDEVITVAAGFPTTVNPILQHHCVPVFVDIDLVTLNLNVDLLHQAFGPRTKAVFLAHTLGNPFDLTAVTNFCRRHHLWLIEDNCDALGSRYQQRYTGSFGDLATLSFYPGHHLTTGEGGAIITSNPLLADIVDSLRNWGRRFATVSSAGLPADKGGLPVDYDDRYTFYDLGYNLKTTDLNTAIGLAQLKKLPRFIATRQRNFKLLYQKLSPYQNYLILHQPTANSQPSWFGFPITVKSTAPFSRSKLVKHLYHHRIDYRLMLAGNLVRQPYFITGKFPHRVVSRLTQTDIVMRQTFWIGVLPEITPAMINYIGTTFDQFFATLPQS